MQDSRVGLRLGNALLVPQQGPSSVLHSAIESADEAALEGVLSALRELKSRALLLCDEALAAQRAQQALQQQEAAEGCSASLEQLHDRGVQLRQDLVGLGTRLRQQAGGVPVALASTSAA